MLDRAKAVFGNGSVQDGYVVYYISPQGAQDILRKRGLEDAALKIGAAVIAAEAVKQASEQKKPEPKPERQLTEEEKERYGRVDFRKGVRDEIWERSKNRADGVVYDPHTLRPMSEDEPWDAGHKPEHKFSDAQRDAAERGITREQWIEEQNNPNLYRAERRIINQSHEAEGPPGQFQPGMPSQAGPHAEEYEPIPKGKK